MPSINKEQARVFFDEITPGEKVAIMYDDDMDGFCSATAVYRFLESKGVEEIGHFVYHYGSSAFDRFLLEDFDRFVVLDIAPKPMIEDLVRFSNKKTIYIDHHQTEGVVTPEQILEYRTIDLGYFPTSRSVFEILGTSDWICLAGALWDAADLYEENNEFIKGLLNDLDIGLDEFVKTVVNRISYFVIYFNDNLDEAFEIFKGVESMDDLDILNSYSDEVEKEVKFHLDEFEKVKERFGDVVYFYLEPIYSVKIEIINFLSRKYRDDVLFFATPKGKDKISMSVRNTSRRINLIKLVHDCMEGVNGSMGGHFSAAGAVIDRKDFEKFRSNLIRLRGG